jgi:dTDP-glucose 4,6-dehydratase
MSDRLKSMLSGSRILLTGASGFAGSHALKKLQNESQAKIMCPYTYTHGGHPDRIPSLIQNLDGSRIELQRIDLSSPESLSTLFKFDFDVIVNFASESHVDRSISSPHDFVSNNIDLMMNLLELARQSLKLKLFLHISTDEVFGSLPDSIENSEWERPHFPSNPYSASKAAQESLLIAYHKTFNLPITIVNVTNMIGETQNQEKFLPKVIRRIYRNEMIQVDTTIDGKIGARRYIHVEDVAEAVRQIIDIGLKQSPKAEVESLPNKFHIAGNKELTNLEIVNLVSRIMNKEAKVHLGPSPRKGYDERYQLSSNKLRKLGWREATSIENRIEQVVKWTLKNKKWLEIDHKSA